jgi:hypothetical protein
MNSNPQNQALLRRTDPHLAGARAVTGAAVPVLWAMESWLDAEIMTVDYEEISPLLVHELAAEPVSACRQAEIGRCQNAYRRSMVARKKPGALINLKV